MVCGKSHMDSGGEVFTAQRMQSPPDHDRCLGRAYARLRQMQSVAGAMMVNDIARSINGELYAEARGLCIAKWCANRRRF